MYFTGKSFLMLDNMVLPLSFTVETWVNLGYYGSILSITKHHEHQGPDHYFSFGVDQDQFLSFYCISYDASIHSFTGKTTIQRNT